MAAKRWRLSAWTDSRPDKAYQAWFTGNCKLCAIDRAVKHAKALDLRRNLTPGTSHWAVGRLSGHLGQWDVVFHDGMNLGSKVGDHAHREPISRTVGTTKRT